MSEVKTFFRFCPECGKRFHIRLLDKKLVGERKERTVEKVRATSGVNVGNPYQPPVPQVLEVDVPVVVDVEDFQYSYRCGHCGHAWTETREKESRKEADR